MFNRFKTEIIKRLKVLACYSVMPALIAQSVWFFDNPEKYSFIAICVSSWIIWSVASYLFDFIYALITGKCHF